MAKPKSLADLLKRKQQRTSLGVDEPGLRPIAAPVDTFAQPALRLPPDQAVAAGRWITSMEKFHTGLSDLGGKILEEAEKERDLKTAETMSQGIDAYWARRKGKLVKTTETPLDTANNPAIQAIEDPVAKDSVIEAVNEEHEARMGWAEDRAGALKEMKDRGHDVTQFPRLLRMFDGLLASKYATGARNYLDENTARLTDPYSKKGVRDLIAEYVGNQLGNDKLTFDEITAMDPALAAELKGLANSREPGIKSSKSQAKLDELAKQITANTKEKYFSPAFGAAKVGRFAEATGHYQAAFEQTYKFVDDEGLTHILPGGGIRVRNHLYRLAKQQLLTNPLVNFDSIDDLSNALLSLESGYNLALNRGKPVPGTNLTANPNEPISPMEDPIVTATRINANSAAIIVRGQVIGSKPLGNILQPDKQPPQVAPQDQDVFPIEANELYSAAQQHAPGFVNRDIKRLQTDAPKLMSGLLQAYTSDWDGPDGPRGVETFGEFLESIEGVTLQTINAAWLEPYYQVMTGALKAGDKAIVSIDLYNKMSTGQKVVFHESLRTALNQYAQNLQTKFRTGDTTEFVEWTHENKKDTVGKAAVADAHEIEMREYIAKATAHGAGAEAGEDYWERMQGYKTEDGTYKDLLNKTHPDGTLILDYGTEAREMVEALWERGHNIILYQQRAVELVRASIYGTPEKAGSVERGETPNIGGIRPMSGGMSGYRRGVHMAFTAYEGQTLRLQEALRRRMDILQEEMINDRKFEKELFDAQTKGERDAISAEYIQKYMGKRDKILDELHAAGRGADDDSNKAMTAAEKNISDLRGAHDTDASNIAAVNELLTESLGPNYTSTDLANLAGSVAETGVRTKLLKHGEVSATPLMWIVNVTEEEFKSSPHYIQNVGIRVGDQRIITWGQALKMKADLVPYVGLGSKNVFHYTDGKLGLTKSFIDSRSMVNLGTAVFQTAAELTQYLIDNDGKITPLYEELRAAERLPKDINSGKVISEEVFTIDTTRATYATSRFTAPLIAADNEVDKLVAIEDSGFFNRVAQNAGYLLFSRVGPRSAALADKLGIGKISSPVERVSGLQNTYLKNLGIKHMKLAPGAAKDMAIRTKQRETALHSGGIQFIKFLAYYGIPYSIGGWATAPWLLFGHGIRTVGPRLLMSPHARRVIQATGRQFIPKAGHKATLEAATRASQLGKSPITKKILAAGLTQGAIATELTKQATKIPGALKSQETADQESAALLARTKTKDQPTTQTKQEPTPKPTPEPTPKPTPKPISGPKTIFGVTIL